ncbi:MAG: FKBP-type peptidyl-prolyl cis-trans isomerase [Cytophagales bacterium]|nr:FKBP-type peptidyl-prolyl cis-trans isomerase [Cytophagales bacterium]
MNLKNTFLLLTLAAFTFSCNQFKVTETKDGDKIQFHTKGESDKTPALGDMITLDLKISSELDSVFTDTWKNGSPIEIPVQEPEFKGSFESALFHLHEGDSATVFVSADSLFGRIGQPLPPGVPIGSDLRFTVKVKSVLTKAEYDASLEDKRNAEADVIAEFVQESLEGAQKLDNGIYFLNEKEGNGATVAKGDTVSVSYVGKFMDGNVFDQNSPFTFPVGLGYVIKGWDEALLTMKKGQKATFVIPSELGYGARGAGGTIPPFTPLVFEIELLEIGRK